MPDTTVISIVIPTHNESIEDMHRLLTSINEQVGVDFSKIEVIFVSDIDDHLKKPVLSIEKFGYFNLKGRTKFYLSKIPVNPGSSRQLGIDKAKGLYIMFCDADDCLFNIGVLHEIAESILYSQADVYRYNNIEELCNGKEGVDKYLIKDYNWVWVFDKIYRRQFLIDNNIRFHKKLRWHEDSYFNLLVRYAKPKVVDIQSSPSYLWHYTEGSITRANNYAYSFDANDEWILALQHGCRYLKSKGHNVSEDVISVIVRMYSVICDPRYIQEKKQPDVIKALYSFIKEFSPELLTEGVTPDIMNIVSKLYMSMGIDHLPVIGFDQFIQLVKNVSEEKEEKDGTDIQRES